MSAGDGQQVNFTIVIVRDKVCRNRDMLFGMDPIHRLGKSTVNRRVSRRTCWRRSTTKSTIQGYDTQSCILPYRLLARTHNGVIEISTHGPYPDWPYSFQMNKLMNILSVRCVIGPLWNNVWPWVGASLPPVQFVNQRWHFPKWGGQYNTWKLGSAT